MLEDVDLRQLADLEGPPRSFVSFYISDEAGLNSLADREQRLRDLLADEPVEETAFDKSMKELKALIEEHELTGERCWALFACAPIDFVRGYAIERPLPAQLRLGRSPYIRPLADLRDEYQRFLIVAADSRATRVLQVTLARHETIEHVRGDVKNRVRKGGWSQKRYARRREGQFERYAKEVAEVVAKVVREEGIERVVLLGAQEALGHISESLAPDVADRVVADRPFDLGEGEEALVEEAFELYFEEERDLEERLWERIKGEYMAGGLAVAGPADVLEATIAGRADTVLVARDARIDGSRCNKCTNLFCSTVTTCPHCGSDAVLEIPVVDEIVRSAEKTSAELEFADPIPGLDKMGGVAALLRY